jgi:hypothetical protein
MRYKGFKSKGVVHGTQYKVYTDRRGRLWMHMACHIGRLGFMWSHWFFRDDSTSMREDGRAEWLFLNVVMEPVI